ncbi:MAG: T9SS type A sorting domain-containing protein [Bacteroidales bacterium]|nr:T9SS type A sorting domain-containing protein [Bacteroidales bacterium]
MKLKLKDIYPQRGNTQIIPYEACSLLKNGEAFLINDSINKIVDSQNIVLINPNPASDEIKIISEGGFTIREIFITDALGRIVFKNTYSDERECIVNVSTFVNGMYLAHTLLNNGLTHSKNITIEKQ